MTAPENYSALLQEFKKYTTLSSADEAHIVNAFRYKKIRKNQLLVQPPDVARFEHFVISGCLVEYFIGEDGIQHSLLFAPEGWWMTDLKSFSQQQESKYFIQAVEESELLTIDRDALEKLLDLIPSLHSYFRKLYQGAIISQKERILNVLSTKLEERYIRFLQKYPQLENRLPQYLIASYLGVTAEFFSRVKSKMNK